MRASFHRSRLGCLIILIYTACTLPAIACIDPQQTPYNVKGEVTWGNPKEPQPPGTSPRLVREDLVPPGGRLTFRWTAGITSQGAILPNDCYDIFQLDNDLIDPVTVKMILPVLRPHDLPITDWIQTIQGVTTKGIVAASVVHAGNIQRNSPWSFHPLTDLPDFAWRVPDLAAFDAAVPMPLYTAVNLGIYLRDNPNGFLDGHWSIGATLADLGISIIDGQIAGLHGIYWSTTDFIVDVNSETGWMPMGGSSNFLNSDDWQSKFGAIGILGSHSGGVSEPSNWGVLAVCACGIVFLRRSRRQGAVESIAQGTGFVSSGAALAVPH